MNHSSNESLSKLEFKNDFISDFAKNKLVEVVRVTNDLLCVLTMLFLEDVFLTLLFCEMTFQTLLTKTPRLDDE